MFGGQENQGYRDGDYVSQKQTDGGVLVESDVDTEEELDQPDL